MAGHGRQRTRPLSAADAAPGLPDLTGDYYRNVLARIHNALRPRTYLEVGVEMGETLCLSRCAAIAVDPQFRMDLPHIAKDIYDRPSLHLYQMTSDDFFAAHDPAAIFGRTVDMAFLDGMHHCEYLLRDFANTERSCRPDSLVVLHDCLPVEPAIASRMPFERPAAAAHRKGWWAGDVWRAALLLKRKRPDLKMTVLNAPPTGLVLITSLDPEDRSLGDNYERNVAEMLSWSLEGKALTRYHKEMDVQSTDLLSDDAAVAARYGVFGNAE
jgi:hypothetical protein